MASGGNLQPWKVHVLMDDARDQIVEEIQSNVRKGIYAEDQLDYPVYPDLADPETWKNPLNNRTKTEDTQVEVGTLDSIYRSRCRECGKAMFQLLGISRGQR